LKHVVRFHLQCLRLAGQISGMSRDESTIQMIDRWCSGDDAVAAAIYLQYAARLCALAESVLISECILGLKLKKSFNPYSGLSFAEPETDNSASTIQEHCGDC
jgi:hypothetical protein